MEVPSPGMGGEGLQTPVNPTSREFTPLTSVGACFHMHMLQLTDVYIIKIIKIRKKKRVYFYIPAIQIEHKLNSRVSSGAAAQIMLRLSLSLFIR